MSELITDEMLSAAVEAMKPDRIQGFLYGIDRPSSVYVIRDVFKPHGHEQEIFRCPASELSDDEWTKRCEMERLRIGLAAALTKGERDV